jgi:hypothetical protein
VLYLLYVWNALQCPTVLLYLLYALYWQALMHERSHVSRHTIRGILTLSIFLSVVVLSGGVVLGMCPEVAGDEAGK